MGAQIAQFHSNPAQWRDGFIAAAEPVVKVLDFLRNGTQEASNYQKLY